MKKRIKSMITGFRDGFQSYFGARVLTEDFVPAFEAAVDAGLEHFEIGGGARFQTLYFYCNEDAFEMMDTLRSIAGPEANLQTLSRGINVVGLDSQSREIIDLHARMFGKHGVSTIRNFDALNDVNNLTYSGQRIAAAGLNHEVCVTMMGLPPGVDGAHTPDFYIGVLRNILDADIPYSSICFKDASGTSTPQTVYETIKAARKLLGEEVHLVFHSHESAGVSIAQYVSAVNAGADQVDCSLKPVSGGTSQPDILTLWNALRGTEFDLGIDVEKVREVERIFTDCMAEYFFPPEALSVEPSIVFSPMPGGALTANTQMMRDNGIMDRYPDVIRAMGEVVAKGGFGTSVTPVSQFYFQQAFNNVMFGPWERIAEGYGKMVLGYFGRTPMPPDPDVIAKSSEALNLEPTERIPVAINDEDPTKGEDVARTALAEAGIQESEENLFIAATCRDKGIQYLKGEARVNVRKRAPEESEHGEAAPPEATATDGTPYAYRVVVDGVAHTVVLDGDTATVNGREYAVEVAPEENAPEGGGAPADGAVSPEQPRAAAQNATSTATTGGSLRPVSAPFPGLVLRIASGPGTKVAKGDLVLVLESMKMESEISAPVGGTVERISVSQGDQVKSGDTLAFIRES